MLCVNKLVALAFHFVLLMEKNWLSVFIIDIFYDKAVIEVDESIATQSFRELLEKSEPLC